MEETLRKKVEEFKEILSKDERIIRLGELENKLYQDPALLELVKKKDDLEREYNSILNYEDKNSESSKKIEKALYEAKKEMDQYPLALEYSEAFIKVRDLYMQIDDILFGPFRKKTLSSKVK